MSVILVCGDRNWKDEDCIRRTLKGHIKEGTTIIHGNCRGADKIADKISRELGLATLPYTALWKKYGRAAGPLRNKAMLEYGKPDLVIAFHANISQSKGTKNMVELAKKANVPVIIVEGER